MPENESITPDSEAFETETAQCLSAEAAAAREREGAETVKGREETPVIDVHARHGELHTWKDFWIHLGTITLGLLIAISLEQSVEWLHHRHQRHTLEAELRKEGERNHELLLNDIKDNDARLGWLLRLRIDVDRMAADRQNNAASYRSFAEMDPQGASVGWVPPSEAAWDTAKEDRLVSLLDPDEAKLYDYLYKQFDFARQSGDHLIAVQLEQSTFEARFDAGMSAGTTEQTATIAGRPDLSRMTAAQLQEYSALLTKNFMAQLQARNNDLTFDALDNSILNGAETTEDLVAAIKERFSRDQYKTRVATGDR